MDTVLVMRDPKGRKIHLSRERWKHIIRDHPDVSLPGLEEVVTHPQAIIVEQDVAYYTRWYKERRKHLIVSIKYLNGAGFVITSFYGRQSS